MTLILRRKMGDGRLIPRPEPSCNWNPRRSGRTTRMIEAALVCARSTIPVYLVFANRHIADVYRREILRQAPPGATVEVVDFSDPRLELGPVPRLRSAEPHHELFIDHHALEVVYHDVLQRFHRYDWSPP